MRIIVTVGMGQWPFDRLLRGVIPLCADHEMFVQTGTSKLAMPCEAQPFIGFDPLMERLEAADLIITHGGNTVRIAQRLGKLPIATAREERFGEMANDHQVAYIRHEEALDRVVAAWDPDDIPRLVAEREEGWRLNTPVPESCAAEAAERLTQIWTALRENPFRWKSEPILAFLWEELASAPGRHLALGTDAGTLVAALRARGVFCEALATMPSCAIPYDSISLPFQRDAEDIAELSGGISSHLADHGRLMIAVESRHASRAMALLGAADFQIQRRDQVGRVGLIVAKRL